MFKRATETFGNGRPARRAIGVSSGRTSRSNRFVSERSSRGRQSAGVKILIRAAASAGWSSSRQRRPASPGARRSRARASASVCAGVRPSGPPAGDSGRRLFLELGHPHAEELVEVRRGDRAELHALEERQPSGSAASSRTRRSKSIHESSRFSRWRSRADGRSGPPFACSPDRSCGATLPGRCTQLVLRRSALPSSPRPGEHVVIATGTATARRTEVEMETVSEAPRLAERTAIVVPGHGRRGRDGVYRISATCLGLVREAERIAELRPDRGRPVQRLVADRRPEPRRSRCARRGRALRSSWWSSRRRG